MSALNIEQLLAPVDGPESCGEDLEYDPAFMDMEASAAGRPEQQFGDTVIPGEEPDWKGVYQSAIDLLQRTKDLRVGTYLTRAAVHLHGHGGLRDGLELLCGLVQQYWDGVHPKLDPDDDHDPTMRINTLSSLCDPSTSLRAIRDATLVRSRGLGSFGYREVMMALGELPTPEGTATPDMSSIDGAFADCDLAELTATAAAVQQSLEFAQRLEQTLTEQVGASRAPSFSDMTDLLRAIHRLLQDRLGRRGVFDAPPAEPEVPDNGASGGGAVAAVPGAVAAPVVAAAPVVLGEINSREDVIRALDKICKYYSRYEPSSPVPLLLKRAKRLASKSFLEILRDLTPEAVQQALSIGGIMDDGSSDNGLDDGAGDS